MGREASPGLRRRGEVWWADKVVAGYGRIQESTGTRDLEEAEQYLNHRMEEITRAKLFGVRPTRIWREAATKFLTVDAAKKSIDRDAQDLKALDPYIGDLSLPQVHMGTLEAFVRDRLKDGKKSRTINRALRVVRYILTLAERSWRDEFGLTWLASAPQIDELAEKDKRTPYPLSWDEQNLLFRQLPRHLRHMAMYKVNVGSREQEVVQLQWSWEVPVPELKTSVFVLPAAVCKNSEARIVVLNHMARHIVELQRGLHPEFVFTRRKDIRAKKKGPVIRVEHHPVTRMYNSGWKRARSAAAKQYKEKLGKECPDGFACIRVHDLRHTFGRRLRSKGVTLEDRQDLLGHKSGRITTEYSAAEIQHLIVAVEKIWEPNPYISPTVVELQARRVA